MASTAATPSQPTNPGSSQQRGSSRSHSRTRSGVPSRPTTPLRPPSRTSLRASQTTPTVGSALGGRGSGSGSGAAADTVLSALEPAFAELSDGMADLEANMMHLQLLHESLGRFNENFGAFLYGMNMSAFCVDFPEAPISQSFARHKERAGEELGSSLRDPRSGVPAAAQETEATFLTTDTSFVENPPTSTKSSKYSSVPSSVNRSRQTVGGGSAASVRGGRGRAAGAGTTSGIARGTSSRGGTGSRIGRGASTQRGTGRGVR